MTDQLDHIIINLNDGIWLGPDSSGLGLVELALCGPDGKIVRGFRVSPRDAQALLGGGLKVLAGSSSIDQFEALLVALDRERLQERDAALARVRELEATLEEYKKATRSSNA